jgi:hypothetical protein
MKTYLKFGAIMAVIVGSLVWLAVGGVADTKTYYKTIPELQQMGKDAQDHKLRVGGDVQPGSIVKNGMETSFMLHQGATTVERGLCRLRSAARHFPRQRYKRWPTAAWVPTAFSAPTKFKPSAHRNMKPSRTKKACASRADARQDFEPALLGSSMENIGALAILVSFCLAVFAIAASLTGKYTQRPFLVISAERECLRHLGATHERGRPARLLAHHGRFPLGLRGRPQQQRHARRVQIHRLVGWTGRLAAALVLAAVHLFRNHRFHQPAQIPRHDAAGHVHFDDRSGVLRRHDHLSSPAPFEC